MEFARLVRHWAAEVLSPAAHLQRRYQSFRKLLEHDRSCHELIARLEELHYLHRLVDWKAIEHLYNQVADHLATVLACLHSIHPTRYRDLDRVFKRIDAQARLTQIGAPTEPGRPWIVACSEITSEHHDLVGGKAYQLARAAAAEAIEMPLGFVVTTQAFRAYLEHNRLQPEIDRRLASLDPTDRSALTETARDLTQRILAGTLPTELEQELLRAFQHLQSQTRQPLRVALRSSALAEDSSASFAGQYRTVLNVAETDLVRAYQQVLAGKYSERALLYRIRSGLGDEETAMAVVVLEMVEARASGVIYTRNPAAAADETLAIHAVAGLGEALAEGRVSPTVLLLSRDLPRRLVAVRGGGQDYARVPEARGGTRGIPLDPAASATVINQTQARVLADWGLRLEALWGQPLDIEWCLDQQERLLLLQVRPLRLESMAADAAACQPEQITNPVLASGGQCASGGLAVGPVFILARESDLDRVPEGAILVARYPSPQYARLAERVAGVVTEVGSPAAHFASVAREFGLPLLVDLPGAMTAFTAGTDVTLAADRCTVFAGRVPMDQLQACARPNVLDAAGYRRRLAELLQYVAPLHLTDPEAATFSPAHCRSLHDLLRFCHERATQEMFAVGDRRYAGKRGAFRLVSPLPVFCYVLDLGGGMQPTPGWKRRVQVENIHCAPFQALWRGLTHPRIQWSRVPHFNWVEYDRIAVAGGIISPNSALFASYAVVSRDYLNLSLKFGYHFVILDALSAESGQDNHILLSFSGGGADFEQRSLRAEFLRQVLDRLQFQAKVTGDVIEARFQGADSATIAAKLDWLGRLLGATRLLDMRLRDAATVIRWADQFMRGRYDFSREEPGDA